jgi:hypothetical protein
MKCDRNIFCVITFTVGVLVGSIAFGGFSLQNILLALAIGGFFHFVRKINFIPLKNKLFKG